MDRHIRLLHDYNEVKDAAQMLMGKLAEKEGVCTKDMYGRYGLEIKD